MESLRSEIERIDSEIIELVASRRDVSREMGLTKEKDGSPVRDKARESEVVSRLARQADALGIDGELVAKIAKILIDDSVGVQSKKQAKVLSEQNALVVGGSGRMGEWTCRFLSNRGASVKVWDPRGALPGYPSIISLKAGVSDADIVAVASPLGVCPSELAMVIGDKPAGLVFDLCSVKSHIASQLTAAARAGTRITSVHPMFGPSAASPWMRNVLVCECGCERADAEVEALFASAGANVSRVSLKRHDELMAYVLGLSHLTTLLFGTVLSRSDKPATLFDGFQGPSFIKLSRLAKELSHESKRVYHDIQSLNPNTRHIITSMEEVLRDLKKAALDDDHAKFSALMESNKTYQEVR